MASPILRLLATAAIASRLVAGVATVGLCTEGLCKDCPTKLDIIKADMYPFCGMWNSTELLGNYSDFKASTAGGYEPFLNIPQPTRDCKIIIRKVTDTHMPGCGIPIAAFHQPICYPLSLPTLFMVQECCDLHDCLRDGNGNAGKSNEARSLERRGIGKTPMDVSDAACANHGKLTRPFPPANPVRIGKKPVPGKITTRWQQRKFNLTQFPRQPGVKDGCKDKGSWRIIHTYTKPSTLSTVVSERLDGGRKGGHLQVSTARADAWTSTITVSAQLNFGFTKFRRALFPGGNFGSTRSEAHSCTITDTKTFWIDVEEQRSGQMAWTGYHECEVGVYTCKGRQMGPHEMCFPQKEGDHQRGIYHVILGN